MAAPPAATITTRAVLEMLDGPKRGIAEAIANDQYVYWLGSGISRERMPDLEDLAKRILCGLQDRIDPNDEECRYRRALIEVLELAHPTTEEWARVDYDQPAQFWPDIASFSQRLVNRYAEMLNVTPEGEDEDFLLWEVLDVAALYSDPRIEPDSEHYSLAALALEGVASEITSANWDPLLERAVEQLAGDKPVLRVVIAPHDVRQQRRRANLYKFHGCALAARRDPENYRHLLVARQNQIHGWLASNVVIKARLTSLAVDKRTLMLGLSAQDSNIQVLFADAQNQMPWEWPSTPPAYAFSENDLGSAQRSLLQNVYRHAYSAANRPKMEEEAVIRAYAKPLLVALYLFVVTSKLKLLVDRQPHLANENRGKFHEGLEHARGEIADSLTPTADFVSELLEHVGRTIAMLRHGSLPLAADGFYTPLTSDALHCMPADPNILSSGIQEFAIAASLIGLGLKRRLWAAQKADLTETSSGAVILRGRSGAAKMHFASSSRAAIQLETNGLIDETDDTVIVHSEISPPSQTRYPRKPPGRTGLAALREVSIEELLTECTDADDLLERFRSEAAL